MESPTSAHKAETPKTVEFEKSPLKSPPPAPKACRKRLFEDESTPAGETKKYKPTIVNCNPEDFVDGLGEVPDDAHECAVSYLPGKVLLKIVQIETVDDEENPPFKVVYLERVKYCLDRGSHNKFRTAFGSKFYEALKSSTHLSFLGQKRANRSGNTYNDLRFYRFEWDDLALKEVKLSSSECTDLDWPTEFEAKLHRHSIATFFFLKQNGASDTSPGHVGEKDCIKHEH